jgi:hypothetical protein
MFGYQRIRRPITTHQQESWEGADTNLAMLSRVSGYALSLHARREFQIGQQHLALGLRAQEQRDYEAD